MEEILWRFPHIGDQIFNRLSNHSLAKCKTISKTWNDFIIHEKFYKQRVAYEMIQKDKDKNGKTQLHQKARNGQLSDCKLIIDHVENKNPADKFGVTPLHLAANNGNFDICKLIIEKIVDKNPASKSGCTPLHCTARNGNLDICRLIIENVDNKYPFDKHGRTPKDIAKQRNHFAVSQLFDS